MKPEVDNGDIMNLVPYHFYMKVSGDVAEDAFSGITVPLELEGSNKVALRQLSRKVERNTELKNWMFKNI